MTNKERREVARRLRENAEAHPDMSLVLNVAFADEGLRPEGMKEWKVTSHDAAMRLADLIDPGEDVSVDAYDLLPDDEREHLWWAKSVGCVDAVYRQYCDADNRRIELCAALGIDTDTGWSDAMAEMVKRLMPEDMGWPRFEDGEPVRIGDDFEDLGQVAGIKFGAGGVTIEGTAGNSDLFITSDERVNRPAPKVLDADGVEIDVGDDLYSVDGMLKFHVSAIDKKNDRIATEAMFALDKWADPNMYTHRAPVIAADGKPLREGETVWFTTSGREIRVDKIEHRPEGFWAIELFADGSKRNSAPASVLTHERPEIDSWERLEDDATVSPETYCVKRGIDISDVDGTHLVLDDATERMARDLVRRAKALAERGE